jgi:phosphoribosylglycinamide formyltransferase-1
MLKIGWFSTGNGKGSLGFIKYFLEYIKKNNLDISLEYVFVNREYGEQQGSDNFIDYLKINKINTITLSSKNFKKKNFNQPFFKYRREYDLEVKNLISSHDTDLIVMAGYMLILSDILCNEFRFINLHPALPKGPKGTWVDVIKYLISNNITESGLNVHVVTNKLDAGQSIGYCNFSYANFNEEWEEYYELTKNSKKINYQNLKLFSLIRNQILDREKILLLCVIEEFLKNKQKLEDVFHEPDKLRLFKSINYSSRIDAMLS